MGRGLADSSLKYHLMTAKKNGITKAESAAIITHAAFYAGWPMGWAVFNMAKEVWADDEPALTEKINFRSSSYSRSEIRMMHLLNILSDSHISL